MNPRRNIRSYELGFEEGKVVFELLQSLVAEYDDLVQELALEEKKPTRGPRSEISIKKDESRKPSYNRKASEMESANGINLVGPCENKDEVEKGKTKAYEVKVEKDETKAYKVKVKKDETKAYEVDVDKDKDEINKKDDKNFEVFEKTAKMDHVDGTLESSLETGIDVEKEIPWNYRKPTGLNSERKLDKLEEVNLEKKIVDDEPLDESDC
ncbi:hypothetical protein C2G38_2173635 [Gigaspora rosea]|uniref:Uncharacterized protein n=1 Tax=Gigaspora rosea TaxID=44941 RepID=A0A397VU77_9GLOM|nr:hypothetical protein C2G38_2173635 [Gigaspora rosea]